MPASYTPPVNLHSPGPIGDVTPSTVSTKDNGTFAQKIYRGDGTLIGQIDAQGAGSDCRLYGNNTYLTLDAAGQVLINANGGSAAVFGNGYCGLTGVQPRADNTYPLGTAGARWTTIFANLPTSDPHVVGEFWSNLGIVTQSAG